MSSLTEDIDGIIRTLAHILQQKGQVLPVKILKHANIDIRETSYDNWNGGTYGYTVNLQVPVSMFALIEDNIEQLEIDLLTKLKPLTRTYSNEYLESVIIAPKLMKEAVEEDGVAEENSLHIETIRFWTPGYFRLFLSHISDHKMGAIQLQKIMGNYAISVFVAHADIEPTKEWQDEIELALSSMDALAALLTPGFKESKWCDQEVGVAIGRKVPVLPIRAGINPYGFIGKYQGIAANKKKMETLCNEVFNVLLKKDITKGKMTNALVSKLCNAQSYAESKETVALLGNSTENITSAMVDKLTEATKNNSQVYDSFGVVDKINWIIKNVRKPE
jgi:predicted  nucleic acid-binding Zn-ribbon protein